jgi:site-specific recombinase XerC
MPGFHAGRSPRNKGLRYPADPLHVEEIIAVMRVAGDNAHGCRLRGLVVLLWRAGLRIHEALALAEADLDQRRGAVLVRRGKGGRRREVGMDAWGWTELHPWLENESNFLSARSSAFSPAQHGAASAPAPRPAATSVGRRSRRGFVGASRRISCGTLMPSRWLAKACRCS